MSQRPGAGRMDGAGGAVCETLGGAGVVAAPRDLRTRLPAQSPWCISLDMYLGGNGVGATVGLAVGSHGW